MRKRQPAALFIATLAVVATVAGITLGTTVAGSATQTHSQCLLPGGTVDSTVKSSIGIVTCPALDSLETWQVNVEVPVATTTVPTATTQPTTTTAATTTSAPTTTTTQPIAGAFLSYPHQPCTVSISGGSNIVVSSKTWQGCTGKVALTVSGAHNVYLHDLDFADNGGDIFLINDTGQIRIENIRARNTGDGTIGSGHSNVIQLNNTWDDGSGGISNVNAYGGRTEDMISIFRSGGVDSTHPLVIDGIHLESPLSGSLAWTSGSGTCVNLADAGGHDIILRNSTFLNCGAVGVQMNNPTRVVVSHNLVYGAARTTSNVGLSQWSSTSCSTCTGNSYSNNRVWWVKANGSASSIWLSGNYPVSQSGNVSQDVTLDSSTLRVIL